MKKIGLAFLLLLMQGSILFAVVDTPQAPCMGVYGLENMDVKFYWSEYGNNYYLASDDFTSIYPWYGYHFEGSPNMWGTDKTCYISAHTSDRHWIAAYNNPCQSSSGWDDSDNHSCMIFKTIDLWNHEHAYRAYIPNNADAYIETWKDYWGQFCCGQIPIICQTHGWHSKLALQKQTVTVLKVIIMMRCLIQIKQKLVMEKLTC